MNVLAVVHGEEARAGLFGEVVRERAHRLIEWRPVTGGPRPAAAGAVIVFGGAMHADQDDAHPWLRDEDALLRELLADGTPTLGVCLGAQLLAKATGAHVGPAPQPEVGWVDVELTEPGASDPVLGCLPRHFEAFQWHYYTYGVPKGATELARNSLCTQAFRLGEAVWGIQFHAEVLERQIESWIGGSPEELTALGLEADALRAQVRERIGRWNALGRRLCDGFLDVAEARAA